MNHSNDSVWVWLKQTFWFLWHSAFDANRHRWWLKNGFIEWLKPIEIITIFFCSRMPCKVNTAHFRRYDWQIVIEVWTFQMHRYASIVNGKNFHRVAWEFEIFQWEMLKYREKKWLKFIISPLNRLTWASSIHSDKSLS